MTAVLSEKGQITIPKPVREKLGLLPGAVLEFQALNGRLVGSKKVAHDIFRNWRGKGNLPKGLSVDRYLKRTRDADRG
jgi:antitoxin PrlF